MRRSALPAILSAIIVACAVAMGAAVAHAQGARPGSEIVNTARITWGNGAVELDAEARFTVARPTSNGVLTAWELDTGLSPGPFRDIVFAEGEYFGGTWVPLPEPVDTSSMTGTGTPIDRSAALRVVRSDRIRLGVPVFFTLLDPGLNFDPAAVETVEVTLTDAVTGDTETLRFYETGPDTGEFSAWINTADGTGGGPDGVLATRALSVITAEYNDATNLRNDLAVDVDVGPIDPFGVVFDSVTGQPLDGVEITLVDDATGQPATVYGDDMQAAFPARILTGSRVSDASGRSYQMEPGGFRFPYVAPGRYRFVIGPSDTHAGPSARSDAALAQLAGGAFTLAEGSRLEAFEVAPGPPLRIDVPLDPLAAVQITREGSHAEAGIGEFVEFTVTVTSTESLALTITDSLPPGLAYLPGSLRLDGQPVTPGPGSAGGALVFELPPRPAGQASVLTYGVQIVATPGGEPRLVSRSTITTPGVRRASAEHVLRLRDRLGLEQVAILGQVAAGGCSGLPDGGVAPDLSGIRVLLENGEYVLTDSDGRFTFRDIYRRPRVVQMDVTTLPPGARPVACFVNTRSTGSAISQFVELRPGMMGRVEFYLEFDALPEADAAPDAAPAAGDAAGDAAPDPASLSPLLRYDLAWLDGPGADAPVGFVAPGPAHMPRSEAIDVVVLRPVGAQSELSVNGVAVPAIRSEPMIRSSDGRRELVRFRAVRIGPGRNTLELVIRAADGAVLLDDSREVLFGVRPGRVELVRSSSLLESDGRSQPRIVLRLTDAQGIPIRPGLQVGVTVDAPFGFAPEVAPRASAPASRRHASGRTTATVGENGLLTLPMAPTLEGGTARLTIPLAGRALSVAVPIAVPDRPWVLVGLAEGTLAHESVRRHMRREGEIGNALAGRVSLFAEGVIRGEWLLTLRYDSAEQGEAFHGIDPDADYIVYGDRSAQGNAAQSRFPLYLRLRREGAELLVGDFNTGLTAGGVSINQQVTGARAIFENEDWRVMVFGAELRNRRVEDRIALNGTVGPYRLSQGNIVPHSPHVRLVTVSRVDASEELDSRTLQAGRDYVISHASGQLFLRNAIPAFTPALDRHVLVIDYEVDDELRNGTMAGIRAERQVTQDLRVGATALRATRVEGRDLTVTLAGVDVTYQVTDALRLSAETLLAHRRFADRTLTGQRSEVRAELDRDDTTLSAYLRQQRGQVGLTASEQPLDTTVLGVELRHRLWQDAETPDRTLALEARLLAEADRLADRLGTDAEILLTRSDARLTQSLGLRRVTGRTATERQDDLRLVYRGTWTSEDDRLTQTLGIEGSLRGEGAAAGDLMRLGMGYRLTERISMFGLLDIDRMRSPEAEAHRLTFGAEFTPRDGRSYRTGLSWAVGDGLGASGRDPDGAALFVGGDHAYGLGQGTTATLGVDAQWSMGAPGEAMARPSYEPFGTEIGNPFIGESFTTLRAGLGHETETWGAGLALETRLTDRETTGNVSLRLDGLIGDSWAVGGEAFLGATRATGQETRRSAELRLSAAHRGGPRDPITLVQASLSQEDEGGVASSTALASVSRSQYLSATEFLNMRYGVKHTSATLSSGEVSDLLTLLGVEYRRDVTESMDIGLHLAALHAAGGRDTSYSFGLSLGATPFEDGWLNFGYNFTGFHDADFAGLGHTAQGPFIQFRLKFDADSLRGLVQ